MKVVIVMAADATNVVNTLDFVEMYTRNHAFRTSTWSNKNVSVLLDQQITVFRDPSGTDIAVPKGAVGVLYRKSASKHLVLASIFTMPAETRNGVLNIMGDGTLKWRECHKRGRNGVLRAGGRAQPRSRD